MAEIRRGKFFSVGVFKEGGSKLNFEVTARLDTGVEVEYFKHGGILPFVLRKLSVK